MLRPNLKTFLTVCEAGSFNKAASILFITPSAVLQQIQALESDLKVPLFTRNRKGVDLTPEGEYLLQAGKKLSTLNEEIHREILNISSKDHTICIGTSLMEKCRLLYDLWVLFSAENANCEIQMLSIDVFHRIPERTDLIESVSSDVEWQQDWDFFEICKVPFGFAVSGTHPLADRNMLSVQDLRDHTVLSLNSGTCDAIVQMLDYLKAGGVSVSCRNGPEANTLWATAFRRDILLVPMCWKDILINTVVIPFEKEFLLPYGVFYRRDPQPVVRSFLNFIFETYGEGNGNGIVPVLD